MIRMPKMGALQHLSWLGPSFSIADSGQFLFSYEKSEQIQNLNHFHSNSWFPEILVPQGL